MKIGIQELILVFIVALVVIGPDKLPEYAKKLGQALAAFKKYSNEATKDIRENIVEPLNEAQRPIREAMEPVREMEKEVRDNARAVKKSFDDLGKPVSGAAKKASGTEKPVKGETGNGAAENAEEPTAQPTANGESEAAAQPTDVKTDGNNGAGDTARTVQEKLAAADKGGIENATESAAQPESV